MTDNTNTQYHVERLSKDNIADLATLFVAVYGKYISKDHFIKKYNTAFTGVGNIGLIAYGSGNEPVGFYGVIPCFITFNGRKYLAAQSADTMTHPKHRYKGMFVDLSNRTFELCREAGVNLVFGFPNQNSYHGAVNKLNWHQADTMSCFSVTIKPAAFMNLLNRFSLAGRIKNFVIRRILNKYMEKEDGIESSVTGDGFAGVLRDDEFLRYKLYSRTFVITIEGVKFWLSLKSYLMIGDISGLTADNFSSVISKLTILASRLGKSQIQFHCSTGTTLYHLFKAELAEKPSYPVLFQDFGTELPLQKVKFTFADIDIF